MNRDQAREKARALVAQMTLEEAAAVKAKLDALQEKED